MGNPDWRQIGDQISDSVSRALSSREFREIQSTIQNTVHDIQNAFKIEFGGTQPPAPSRLLSRFPCPVPGRSRSGYLGRRRGRC